MSSFLSTALAASDLQAGSGPQALAGLKEGRVISGFVARSLYLNASDEPMGARFVHSSGLPVDVLFFASVPKVSVYFKTLPVSDRGEPHTLEHLLFGKGRRGKHLKSLLAMRLADDTAGTYTDLTNYQFNTAAGLEDFYELLEHYLQALLKPDFTDEEIRREVANLEVVEEAGRLRLEEKGTVYNEMISTMEKPGSANWYQLARMVFGEGHPLARNQGGEPEKMWDMTPEDIRRFHAANYRLGPNMAMIAALPLSWSAEEFLGRLGEILRRVEPAPPKRTYPKLPPFEPFKEPEVRIGSFPSEDANVPQAVYFAWRPLPKLTKEEVVRISFLLDLAAGGETSYLYKDLIDQETRLWDSGATGVSGFIDNPPVSFPGVYVWGLPVSSIQPEPLGKLRSAILSRVRWMAELKTGSPELAEVAGKARSLIRSNRRVMLKFMDDPPHFGMRHSGADWHRHLDHLNAEPGFRKSVSLKEVFDRLLAEIDSGQNLWKEIAVRAGVLEMPYVSAVRPDAELLRRQKEDKRARLAAREAELVGKFKTPDPQAALRRFGAEIQAKTEELEALDRQIPKPSFVRNPPLTLDEVDYAVERLASGPKMVRTHFGQTPFTEVYLVFDLTRIPPEDLELLPLLSAALGDLGVRTRSGEVLDYAQAEERLRAEIYGVGVGDTSNPSTGRYELSVSASASSSEEVPKAVEWLENHLLRPNLAPDSARRLADVVRRKVKGYRNIFQLSEESWVAGTASALVYQDHPVYMALDSPFTVLRRLSRFLWRLEDPSPEERAGLESELSEIGALAEMTDRPAVAKRLEKAPGEMGEYLRFELSYLPPDGWRKDLARLLRETREDLARPSSETLERLKGLLRNVLARKGVRVHILGRPENTARALGLVDELLRKLPERPVQVGRPKRAPLVLRRLRERYPRLESPVHMALVADSAKTGAFSLSARGPMFDSGRRTDALDYLALQVFSGAGPHSFYSKTWSAGLAYGNGVSASPYSGRVQYYADRCPDLAQTMRFVAGLAARTPLDDPFLVQYALAGAFADYRGAMGFSSRGWALASDLEDGRTPEKIRKFKSLLLKVAQEKGALQAMGRRMPEVLGRVLVDYGREVSRAPGAVGFVVAPEELITKYEVYLKEQGEAGKLVRLYLRDFWPDPD